MAPFSRDDLQLIRASLKAAGEYRDLALLNLGVDTMLRASDLVRTKVSTVRTHTGQVVDAFQVRQKKTRAPVSLGITERTRQSIAALIEREGKWSDDYLFTAAGKPHGGHLSEQMLRILVKKWAILAHLDPTRHSGHSLRRTKAVLIYRETLNPELVRQMLGHRSLAHTVAYLGVRGDDVSAMSRKFDI